MSKSGRTLTTTVMVALSSWSCGSTAPSATPQVAAILVSPTTSTLALDAQLPLQVQVRDGSGEIVADAAVTWTVENPAIASVSAAGVVKALAVGTSQVAANALGKSGLAVVTVDPPANHGTADPGGANQGDDDPGSGGASNGNADVVTTVTVTAPSKKLDVGSTMQLTAVAKDDEGKSVPDQSFVWSSSNTDRATVSASGVVAGKRSGDVTITARTSANGGKSGSVKIEVKKK